MDSAWEGIFMLVILKIPVVYLGAVVWWAIRAEPVSESGSNGDGAPITLTPCGWDDWKRDRRRTGRGRSPIRPLRTHARRSSVHAARARAA